MVKVTSLLTKAGSGVGFTAWTEMEIRCVKGMCRLKLVYPISLLSTAKRSEACMVIVKAW